MNLFREVFNSLSHVAYPQICEACKQPLGYGEKIICLLCDYNLPKTRYHLHRQNPMEKKFYGRVNINRATAFYFFQKEGKVQQLIHALKYRAQTEVGVFLGQLYSHDLAKVDDFKKTDLIIPVPLHPLKEKKRGFNQSNYIAEGMVEGLKTEWKKDILIRSQFTETQTRKRRLARWSNVETIFKVVNESAVKEKNILLVDDVMTTGATAEACAVELQKVGAKEINIATLAFAI